MSPRAFSSGKRSGSVPVSASTSVDLPWSTWPAVATTLTLASPWPRRDHAQRAAESLVVGRVDRAQVAHHRAVAARARPRVPTRKTSQRGVDVGHRERDAGRRDRPAGHRAAAGRGLGVDDRRRRAAVATIAAARVAQLGDRRRGHAPEPDRAAVAGEVGERDGCERGERHLVGAQRTRERMPREQRDEVGAADDDPGLRSAEQLVARERHERGAGVEALADAGLVAAATPAGPASHGVRLVEQPRSRRRPSPAARASRARRPASPR